jgi:hypothetical protein
LERDAESAGGAEPAAPCAPVSAPPNGHVRRRVAARQATPTCAEPVAGPVGQPAPAGWVNLYRYFPYAAALLRLPPTGGQMKWIWVTPACTKSTNRPGHPQEARHTRRRRGTPGGGAAHPRIDIQRSVCGGCWGHCGAWRCLEHSGSRVQGARAADGEPGGVGREGRTVVGLPRVRHGTARVRYAAVVAQRRWFAQFFGTQRSCPA